MVIEGVLLGKQRRDQYMRVWPGTKLTYNHKSQKCPHNLKTIFFSAIANSDCLVFDTAVATMFSENGNLGINVTISQTVNSMNYKSEPQ